MEYRILPPHEWQKLSSIFLETFHEPVPHPNLSQIVVGEEDGEIRCFLAKQLRLHLHPLWAAPEYRGQVPHRPDYLKMLDMIGVEGCFVLGDNPRTDRIAEKAGLTQLPYHVWYKQ